MELPDDVGEWDGKDGKTPEEKIAALVEHIKNEFPNGCKGIWCVDCPVHEHKPRTTEHAVCNLLWEINR